MAAPGFHVIFLPFAEDLRKLHMEEVHRGLSSVNGIVGIINLIVTFNRRYHIGQIFRYT